MSLTQEELREGWLDVRVLLDEGEEITGVIQQQRVLLTVVEVQRCATAGKTCRKHQNFKRKSKYNAYIHWQQNTKTQPNPPVNVGA